MYNAPCQTGFEDLNSCNFIAADRCVQKSAARRMVNDHMSYTTGYFIIFYNDNLEFISLPALSQVHGDLRVIGNNELTSIIFSELAVVTNLLSFFDNAALTYLSVPKLGYIYNTIGICNNHANLKLPTAPPTGPAGGISSVGWKGQLSCWYAPGNSPCGTFVPCP